MDGKGTEKWAGKRHLLGSNQQTLKLSALIPKHIPKIQNKNLQQRLNVPATDYLFMVKSEWGADERRRGLVQRSQAQESALTTSRKGSEGSRGWRAE
mmetsp:Transcript_38134/g.59475  ORF Transcript_38134/g.59475 Transcript_38134/m.59475 type:complete len:97 (-) Transcript_38134:79-369(-)